jgi:hypothetical protein
MLFLKKLLNIHFSATTFSANLNKWRFFAIGSKNSNASLLVSRRSKTLAHWLDIRKKLLI